MNYQMNVIIEDPNTEKGMYSGIPFRLYYHRNKNGHISLSLEYFSDYENALNFLLKRKDAILLEADKGIYEVIKCIDKDGVLYE